MTGDLSKRERFCVQNIFFIAQKRKKRQHFVHFNYPIFNSLKDRKCIKQIGIREEAYFKNMGFSRSTLQ